VGSRLVDRWLPTDLAVYGWAFYFEKPCGQPVVEQPAYLNVCLYCGTGRLTCRCPNCSRTYPYTRPFRNTV
jgi:hypothetical protein